MKGLGFFHNFLLTRLSEPLGGDAALGLGAGKGRPTQETEMLPLEGWNGPAGRGSGKDDRRHLEAGPEESSDSSVSGSGKPLQDKHEDRVGIAEFSRGLLAAVEMLSPCLSVFPQE